MNHNIVQSFVDITDQEMQGNEESKSSWKSRHMPQQRNDSANGKMPVMPSHHHHLLANQLNQNSVTETEQNSSDQKIPNYSKR